MSLGMTPSHFLCGRHRFLTLSDTEKEVDADYILFGISRKELTKIGKCHETSGISDRSARTPFVPKEEIKQESSCFRRRSHT